MRCKCFKCNKKIKKYISDIYTCKCGSIFCPNHLHDHSCSFDHKLEHKEKLRLNLPKIISDKNLIRI